MKRKLKAVTAGLIMLASISAAHAEKADKFRASQIPALDTATGKRVQLAEADFTFPLEVTLDDGKAFVSANGTTYQVRATDLQLRGGAVRTACLEGERSTTSEEDKLGAQQMGSGKGKCRK